MYRFPKRFGTLFTLLVMKKKKLKKAKNLTANKKKIEIEYGK